MRKRVSGFTIVELLIVIVIIAILAAITIVAYNGIQARARDNIRYADAKTIMKALELYKVSNGTYPPTSSTSNPQATCPGIGIGYSYSWASDGSWLKPLTDSNVIANTPKPPINDCTHYYQYYSGEGLTWGCPAQTKKWYLLKVVGAEGTFTPSDSATFKPCPEATVTVGANANQWVFAKYDD